MNEEQIIKNIKEIIQWSDHNTYKIALQGILDLYNKEKEKNKELDKFIKEGITIEPNNPYKNFQLNYLRENFIPKSKVKEEIDSKFKEVKGLYERGVQPQAQYTMKLLRDLEQSLLGKE